MKRTRIAISLGVALVLFGLSISYQVGVNLGYLPVYKTVMAITTFGLASSFVAVIATLIYVGIDDIHEKSKERVKAITILNEIQATQLAIPGEKKDGTGLANIVPISSDGWDKINSIISYSINDGSVDTTRLTLLATLLSRSIEEGKIALSNALLDPLEKHCFNKYDPQRAYTIASTVMKYDPSSSTNETDVVKTSGHSLIRSIVVYLQIITEETAKEENDPHLYTSIAAVEALIAEAASHNPEHVVTHLCNTVLRHPTLSNREPIQECQESLKPYLGTALEEQIIIAALAALAILRGEESYLRRGKRITPRKQL